MNWRCKKILCLCDWIWEANVIIPPQSLLIDLFQLSEPSYPQRRGSSSSSTSRRAVAEGLKGHRISNEFITGPFSPPSSIWMSFDCTSRHFLEPMVPLYLRSKCCSQNQKSRGSERCLLTAISPSANFMAICSVTLHENHNRRHWR